MFALSYRATLAASSTERAAYAVPLDYTLTTGRRSIARSDVASLARYRALAPGVGAWPVLRQVAEAAGTRGDGPLTPTVLGVPAAALPLIHGWRSDFSSDRRPSSAVCCGRRSRSRSPAPSSPRRPRVSSCRLRMTGPADPAVLVVQTRRGDAAQLRPPARHRRASSSCSSVAGATRRCAAGSVVAIQLQLPPPSSARAAHSGAEGRNAARRLRRHARPRPARRR